MIVEDIERKVISNTSNEHAYSIEANAKMFEILSSKIYTYKIAAVVRELCTNAYDSHVEAGKADVPFHVILPNSIHPYFEVEDFGVGLSETQVYEIFTHYGRSTKTESNDFVGALGLGSKTPFAYTTSFTIQTRQDGMEYLFNAYFGDNNDPKVSLLRKRETQESNGVKIKVNLLPTTRRSVGIDLGLKDLFILSNGQAVSNPKWFRKSQAKLKSTQKHLSRKKKGSAHYHKQWLKVTNCYEKTANQRKHFYQSLSSALVREFDLICMEDLNVSGLKKNRNLAKSISDAGWSNFVTMMKYKCDWYGKTFVQIDRFYCSSQICSSCGHKDGKKTLDIRKWKCSNCDIEHDRDLNAAINILNKGFSDLTGKRINFTSAESVDYKRGEDVRLDVHLDEYVAASMKRLDKFINLS